MDLALACAEREVRRRGQTADCGENLTELIKQADKLPRTANPGRAEWQMCTGMDPQPQSWRARVRRGSPRARGPCRVPVEAILPRCPGRRPSKAQQGF